LAFKYRLKFGKIYKNEVNIMKQYIMAIDQGTTSTRTIIFDRFGQEISSSQKELHMQYPKKDHVEQDPLEIWMSVLSTMAQALITAELSPEQITSIGITNQRETTVLWNNKTGLPVYNAIVWQSKQSKDICTDLKAQELDNTFRNKTGLLIDPYFSGTKIKWAIDNVEGVKELMDKGDLSFGTIDSWLIYKLSGNKVHKTDYTNASRTLLYNIFTKEWDKELLDILGINENILPSVHDSNHIFGETAKHTFFGHNIPIAGVLGDQQAALFGQTCFDQGDIKNTYGTGCFMLMNTGQKNTISEKGLLTTIAYVLDGKVTYALEGSVFVAGSAIQWLRDQVEFFDDAATSEDFATSVEDSYGVVVVPAFAGLGTPYWDSEAKGAIFGLTRATSKYHITRATLESLAYQTHDIITAMKEDSAISPTSLKVDGGASNNDFLMQFQSDILNVSITRPKVSESTALGAAYISGLSVGIYKDLQEIKAMQTVDSKFVPSMEEKQRQELLQKWKTAIYATRQFK
jgi:glycerol kinase